MLLAGLVPFIAAEADVDVVAVAGRMGDDFALAAILEDLGEIGWVFADAASILHERNLQRVVDKHALDGAALKEEAYLGPLPGDVEGATGCAGELALRTYAAEVVAHIDIPAGLMTEVGRERATLRPAEVADDDAGAAGECVAHMGEDRDQLVDGGFGTK